MSNCYLKSPYSWRPSLDFLTHPTFSARLFFVDIRYLNLQLLSQVTLHLATPPRYPDPPYIFGLTFVFCYTFFYIKYMNLNLLSQVTLLLTTPPRFPDPPYIFSLTFFYCYPMSTYFWPPTLDILTQPRFPDPP